MKTVLLILLPLCVSVQAEVSVEDVLKETVPGYTIAVNAGILNATECQRALQEFHYGVDQRKLWALRLLDSNGRANPGFVYGDKHWVGKRDECLDLLDKRPLQVMKQILQNNSRYRNPEEEYPPFEPGYFVAYLRQNSTLQYHVRLPGEDLITLGLCMPSSCTTHELGTILKRIFHDRTLLAGQLYSMDFTLLEVSDLRDNYQWVLTGKSIIIILVIGSLLALTIVSTAYDICFYQKRLKIKQEFLSVENNNTSDAETKRELENEEATLASLHSETRLQKIIMCFSIYTNTKKIFSTKLSNNAFPAIHGMKFFGMLWIVMIHTVYYSYPFIDNVVTSYKLSRYVMTQLISNSTLSVDTYFFLAGFLMTYVYIKSEEGVTKKGDKKVIKFFMAVVKRFIRLTPAYMTVVALSILNFSWYDNTSTFKMEERVHEICAKYWWRNILYINNFFSRETMCLSWSWYLSNDMQFFLFGLFVLLLSSTYFYTAVCIACFTLLASIVLIAYTAYVYNYIPTIDETFRLLAVMYDPPWMRIGPYIVGMATAFLLYRLNNKLHLKKRTLVACWSFGIICNCSILFGLMDRQLSFVLAMLYNALCRTGWSLGIAWFVIACATNNAGLVNHFVSLKVWIPLSKLTYCAYLLNPFVIKSVYLYTAASPHMEMLSTGTVFLGIFVITYILAYVLSVIVEVPTMVLLQLFLSRDRQRK